jgi:hypothetical protein
MAIKKSMARNFLLLNYHAFVAIHPLIAVTFSTPTNDCAKLSVRRIRFRMGLIQRPYRKRRSTELMAFIVLVRPKLGFT